MDESRSKYILLNDRVGEIVEKSMFGLTSKTSPTQVLRGELLEALPEDEQPQDSHRIAVVGLDRKTLRFVCPTEDLSRLSDEDADLLLAISSLGERYDIFIGGKRLAIGRKINHGSRVLVKVKGITNDFLGVVLYKGEVQPLPGTMFGVELIENMGQGTSDGTFRNKRYFECPKDSGVFVALDKITLEKDWDTMSPGSPEKEESSRFYFAVRLKNAVLEPLSKGGNERKLSHDAMGRVLEIYQRAMTHINGKAVRGRVRYIGEARDPSGQPYMVVGLELDSKDGAGTGFFQGKQRFVCRHGFACFVPIEEVKPVEDYEGISQEWKNAQKQLPAAEQHYRDEVMARSLSYGDNTADITTELHNLRDEVKKLRLHQRNCEREARDLLHQKQHFEEELEKEKSVRQRAELQIADLLRQLRGQEERVHELETTLSAAQQALDQRGLNDELDWIICRDEIHVTENCLGVGGWGTVVQGTFRGCKVAVKEMHELILSPHTRRLFEREMNIASKCRHPCLLQFIGATNDDGNPLFVTELMESSLRALLQERKLSEKETSTISMDVALALNYLHQSKSPIAHRDVSSANVLLWRQGNKWRGKLSDYGTANFMRQTMTVAPGALIYCAPEALTSNQTIKVDVYSFGVLVCEMCIWELPDPLLREQQVASVTNHLLRGLIRRCIQSEPGARPTMEEVINYLEAGIE